MAGLVEQANVPPLAFDRHSVKKEMLKQSTMWCKINMFYSKC